MKVLRNRCADAQLCPNLSKIYPIHYESRNGGVLLITALQAPLCFYQSHFLTVNAGNITVTALFEKSVKIVFFFFFLLIFTQFTISNNTLSHNA